MTDRVKTLSGVADGSVTNPDDIILIAKTSIETDDSEFASKLISKVKPGFEYIGLYPGGIKESNEIPEKHSVYPKYSNSMARNQQ